MKRSIDYMIDVMKAAKEGKQIQYRPISPEKPFDHPDTQKKEWTAVDPAWNWAWSDYRVEPQKLRVYTVIFRDKDKSTGDMIHSSVSFFNPKALEEWKSVSRYVTHFENECEIPSE